MTTQEKKKRKVVKSCYGVRFYSQNAHEKRGYIYNDLDTIRQAIDAADCFVRDNDFAGTLFMIVNDREQEVELFSIEE